MQLESLLYAVRAYQRYDPQGWLKPCQDLGVFTTLLALAGGLLLLTLGNWRAYRPSAAAVGAFVGLIWGQHVAETLGVYGSEKLLAAAGVVLFGVSGGLYPPAAVFVACGVPAGLLGGHLAGPVDYSIGFIPSALAVGALGALFHRVVAGVITALTGAWLFTLGLLSLLRAVPGVEDLVQRRPLAMVAVAAVFALAGAIYQIAVRPSPEDLARRQQEQAEAQRKEAEKQALARRWGNF